MTSAVLAHIGVIGNVFQGHGGREVRQNARLYPAAQPIGKAGDHAVFFLDLMGEHHVAGDILPVLVELVGVYIDKEILRGLYHSTSCVVTAWMMELRITSDSAAFSPNR